MRRKGYLGCFVLVTAAVLLAGCKGGDRGGLAFGGQEAEDGGLTNGQWIQLLGDKFGYNRFEGSEDYFSDVGPEEWYTQAVVWAETRGLVRGFEDNTFRPGAGVTWEQLERILGRYLGGEAAAAAALSTTSAPEGQSMTRGELAERLMELCEEKK